jgi:hypothetical protein
VETESIFSFAKLVTVLAKVTLGGHVVNFYVVPHIGGLLACVLTVRALPQAFWVLPHLVTHFSIYIGNLVKVSY